MSGRLRERFFTPTGAMRAWTTLLVVVISFGLLSGLTISYVRRVDRENERRDVQRSREICQVVVLIDDRQQKLTPASEDARKFYEAWHAYRVRLGC